MRHPVELGRRLVLREHRTAHLLDGLHAHGAVAPGPREDHGDRPLLEAAGDRLEQEIGGRPDEVDELGLRQRERAVGVHEQVLVGRGDVHHPRPKLVALLRLLDRQRATSAQDVGRWGTGRGFR